MSYLLGIASMFMALFVTLTICPLENNALMTICMIALPTLFMIVLAFASSIEDKVDHRIKTLEDKLRDKESKNEMHHT